MGKDKRKPLVELDSYNGKVKAFWWSGKEAAAFHNIKTPQLSAHLQGRANHVKKKYFRHATVEEIEAYRLVSQRLELEEKPPAKEPETPSNEPVEIIPEKMEKPEEDLSPIEKLIKKGKEKLI